jgi:hypothetical protein
MSKKNKDGGVLDLIAIAAVALVVAAFFLFKLAATIAVIGAPIIAFVAYFLCAQHVRPVIPNAREYDGGEFHDKVVGLLRKRAALLQKSDDLFSEGHQNGIDLTKGSDYQRFRENSALGRRLNQQIDETKRLKDRSEQSIDFVKRAVMLTFPQWEVGVSTWVKYQSVAIGVKRAVLYVVPAFLLSLIVPGSFHSLQSILLVNTSVNIGPLVFSVGVTYIAFIGHCYAARSALASTLDSTSFEEWNELRYRWSVDTNYDAFLPEGIESDQIDNDAADTDEGIGGEDDDGREEDYDEYLEDEDPDEVTLQWYEILQIGPAASIAEIKAAYHKQLKENHPDNVATMGAKIREVAESQSKLINAAYAEARAERHF